MTANGEVQDSHGFFQFIGQAEQNTSSDDEGDDGIFSAPRQRKKEFDISKINYHPKLDRDLWYDKTRSEVDYSWWFNDTHSGITEMKYTIHRYFAAGEIRKALDLSMEFLRLFEERERGRMPKVSLIREVIEIAVRASLKLGDKEKALQLLEEHKQIASGDVGNFILWGDIYSQCGKRLDAIREYISYDKIRPNDPTVWVRISQCVREATSEFDSRIADILVLASLNRAREILEFSRPSLNPIAKQARAKQITSIESKRSTILKDVDEQQPVQGDKDSLLSWLPESSKKDFEYIWSVTFECDESSKQHGYGPSEEKCVVDL
ncbi:hypothetical protein H4219_001673 [Mycoemilia scoparia]|uniref:Uncharacterized protein n=1 Tax=Mycoemilia scoparia TaxID=417184 RepID=A0A9W8A7J9_9FUNG|nr:hypothetical protein H4219_001673 [Mycoemilia scoparia]